VKRVGRKAVAVLLSGEYNSPGLLQISHFNTLMMEWR